MTNKDKINRVKEIEAQQISLIDGLKVLDNSIRDLDPNSNEYLMAREIYDEHSADMKDLISEKIPLLLSLGFFPKDGMVDEPIKDTDLWKSLENDIEVIMASKEVSDERYSICTGCPEFVAISKQCKKCACFMDSKTKLAEYSCPIGKW
jgi:hypothetical protein